MKRPSNKIDFRSARSMAAALEIPLAEILAVAKSKGIGEPGPHRNSPRRFAQKDGERLCEAILTRRVEAMKVEKAALKGQQVWLQSKIMSQHRALIGLCAMDPRARRSAAYEELSELLRDHPFAPPTDSEPRREIRAQFVCAALDNKFPKAQNLAAELIKIMENTPRLY